MGRVAPDRPPLGGTAVVRPAFNPSGQGAPIGRGPFRCAYCGRYGEAGACGGCGAPTAPTQTMRFDSALMQRSFDKVWR